MRPIAIAIAIALLAPALSPQDTNTAAKQTARLRKALQKTAALPSLSFVSRETQDSAFLRQLQRGPFGARGNKRLEIRGVWSSGLLAARFADNELVIHGRRAVAREGDGAWKLRRDRVANGAPAPFLFDPELFFAAMLRQKLDIAHAEVGSWNDRPIEILTSTFRGDDALELEFAGLVPSAGSGPAGIMVLAIAGRQFRAPKKNLTVDIAFFVDPATHLVHRVRMRATTEQQGAGAGVVVVRAGGQGQQEEEEEEEEEREQDESEAGPRHEDGLPVRKVGQGTSRVTLDVELGDLGNAAAPDLNEAARELLGLPGGK